MSKNYGCQFKKVTNWNIWEIGQENGRNLVAQSCNY